MRRGTVEAFVLHAAGIGLLFLMHTILGRALGTEGYGTFSYALTLAGVLAIVVPLGWPTALMRFIAQYVEQQRWELLRGAIQRAYQITLFSAALAAVALWAISHWNRVSPDLATSLRFAALLLPLLAFVGLRRKALQGLQRVKASIAVEEIFLPLVVIAGMYLFAITSSSGALLLYAGAAFLAFLVGSVWLWRSLPAQSRAAKPEFRTRPWMAVAIPMIFGGLGQIILNRTDVIMLGAMTDMESVGLYGAATRLATLNTFVLGAVNTIAAPMIAAAFYGSRYQQVREIMVKAMLWSTIGALPLFAVMLFQPQLLLSLFGTGFIQAGALLQILAVGQFVNAATGPVGFALQVTGRERMFALAIGTAATANVVGNLLAIPAFGAIGAAYVTAASIMLLNLILLALVWLRITASNHTGE